MAAIAITSMGGKGSRAATMTTLTASDTLAYEQGRGMELILRNPTAGSINVTLDGVDNTVAIVQGAPDISTTAGLVVTVGIGLSVAIPLDSISAYLVGAVTLTGGTGLVAICLRNG